MQILQVCGRSVTQSKQQKWPLMYQSSHVYQDCTNRVPIVKNSQTAKMTIGVPIITCLRRVHRIHKVRPPRPRPRRRIHKALCWEWTATVYIMSSTGTITATRRQSVHDLGVQGVVHCLFSSGHKATKAFGDLVSDVHVVCIVCVVCVLQANPPAVA